MEKRRLRMLKAYPLPAEWVEVPDYNTYVLFKINLLIYEFIMNLFNRNRYYYWNPVTDQVAWLSPSHPKAKIEYAKTKIQEIK